VTIQDGRPRTVSYVTDASGKILSRVEASSASSNPAEYYYDFNGMRVGDIGNNGPSQTNYAAAISARSQAAQTGPFANGSAQSFADFDQSYDAINPSSAAEAGVSGTYIAQAGDTLQSIALAAWGDSNLWYLIAEANGLFGAVSLQAGQNITIPTKVSNYHNDASTFRVYDPNKALGNVQPTVPRSHHSGCGLLGQILLLVVAVAVAAFTEGALLGAATSILPGIGGTILGEAAVAATASIVSQGVGLATGIQTKFSWSAVGEAALTAGVSAGVGASGIVGFSGFTGSSFVSGALNSVVTRTLTQGIEVAAGLQKHFDWTAVAAAAVGGGVGSAVGANLPIDLGSYTASVAGTAAVAGMAGGIANAATRSLIDGTDFGDNIIAALPDVIAQTVGSVLAGAARDASLSEQYKRFAGLNPDDIMTQQVDDLASRSSDPAAVWREVYSNDSLYNTLYGNAQLLAAGGKAGLSEDTVASLIHSQLSPGTDDGSAGTADVKGVEHVRVEGSPTFGQTAANVLTSAQSYYNNATEDFRELASDVMTLVRGGPAGLIGSYAFNYVLSQTKAGQLIADSERTVGAAALSVLDDTSTSAELLDVRTDLVGNAHQADLLAEAGTTILGIGGAIKGLGAVKAAGGLFVRLEAYNSGSGHHVPAKRAFEGAPGYDPKKALAIPKDELKRLGISHGVVTGAQQTLYRAFAKSGETLTWDVVQRVETQALVRGGLAPNLAKSAVKEALESMKASGVSGPIRIPWGD